MNKIVKKTIAAALALTIVGGAAPALTGGFDALKPAITANAAETKTIAEGVIFSIGDTIHLDRNAYILTDDSETTPVSVLAGDYLIPSAEYKSGYGQFKFAPIFNGSLLLTPPEGGSTNPDYVVGIKVVSGSGTSASPYKFEVFYKPIVSVASANVTLDDSITLKFYATKASVAAAGIDSVTLTGPNDSIEVKSTSFKTDSSRKNYVFSYPLYATQLDEDVTIQFKFGETLVSINSYDHTDFSYSINDYCDYVISGDGYNDSTLNAVKSLKNLGIAADNYFDETTNAITFLDSEYDLSSFAPKADADVKFSLVLDSRLSARVYIPGLPYGIYDENMKYKTVRGKDGINCFEVPSINPAELGNEHTIKYDDSAIKFTPLAFCYRAIANNSEKSTEIAKAIYEYYKYTKAYVDDCPTITVKRVDMKEFEWKEFKIQRGMTWRELFVNTYGAEEYDNIASVPEGEYAYTIVGDTVWLSCKKIDWSHMDGTRILDVSADEVIDPEKEYYYTVFGLTS